MATGFVTFGPVKKTRFSELSYQRQGDGNWRFIDNATERAVGAQHPSEASLLSHVESYAELFGCEGAEKQEKESPMIDFKAIDEFLTEAAERYEKTAPTVTAYINDLYIRLHEDNYNVRLGEILTCLPLKDCGQWEQPNYAANRIYKLMHRLGMDTTGHAGF